MKKFYAFVCAVAVALTASAGPIDFAPKAKKDITKLELSTKSSKIDLTNAKRVKRASRISANDAALEGDKLYLEESYSLLPDSASESGAEIGWQVDSPVTLRRAEDGTYTIENFYGWEGVNLTGGAYDAAEGTLSFQPQTLLSGFSAMGAPFESMMVAICDEEGQLTEEPIVFAVDIPNRNLYYQGKAENNTVTAYVGIVALDAENEYVGHLDYLYAIDFNQVNGMSAFGYYNSNDEPVKEQIYVYNEIVEGNLVTTGLFGVGFGFPVTFTLNKETNTAVADNQVVLMDKDGTGAEYDFMFYNMIFNEDSTNFEGFGEPVETFDIIQEKGEAAVMTYISTNYTFVGTPYQGKWAPLVEGGFIYGFQVLYVGDIFDPTGIHDVQLDKNTNAPVEYYNLQGIRVNEPTKGGIYIRRQGNVSTKIMR